MNEELKLFVRKSNLLLRLQLEDKKLSTYHMLSPDPFEFELGATLVRSSRSSFWMRPIP